MTQQAAYECNGAPVAPDAFYAIACDPRRSVAVEACAGAGKTWMLVSRMLRALLEDAEKAGADGALQPHEILAITFTKRAAGEMRERLYEWLAEFAHADSAKLVTELRIRGVTGLDDAAVAEGKADDKGDWQATLAEGAPGLHSLRADEVDAAGKVISRYETPFQREVPVVAAAPAAPEPVPAEPAPEPAPAPITVTVQPGLTLWAIARDNFGEGTMYVQVFEANRDKIKDPDLIYPGQVFTVPKP